MKPRFSHCRETGMTLFEIGVVIAIVLVMAALILPLRLVGPTRVKKINCTNHLKQVGLAYRIWEGDNSDMYPMGISVTNGGSMEMAVTGNVVQSFLVMSNELATPNLLICPVDTNRNFATIFSRLDSSNISYFIGVDATNDIKPQMIISGDSNFELSSVPVRSGLFSFGTNDPISWTATRHIHSGNIGFADGSVLTATSARLPDYFVETGLSTIRLAIP